MKIYLSHNWAAREWLRDEIVPKLQDAGYAVVSRWLTDDVSNLTQQGEAQNDVIDVGRADLLIIFADNYGDRPGRGKYVELGMALAYRIPVVVVGKADDCVFYELPQVIKIKDLETLLSVLIPGRV